MERSWKCDICRKDDDNPIEYGNVLQKSNIRVHYYCMLLSTHLPQKGQDNAGILGFLIKDIREEINAAKDRICSYCTENHASIKCSKCDVYFHLICGLENNCLNQFCGDFKSFCHEHHGINHNRNHSPLIGCYICMKKMGEYNPLTSITSNCCSSDIIAWAHRKCLKQYALAAGYYLKCIWCGNKEFRDYVRLIGIFVPDRDASWELLKGAYYAELYNNIKKKCMAIKCKCPHKKKREYQSKKWYIIVCVICGAFATHSICRKDRSNNADFMCKECEEISGKILKKNGDVIALLNRSTICTKNNDSTDSTMFTSKSYQFDNTSLNSVSRNLETQDLCVSPDNEAIGGDIEVKEENIEIENEENMEIENEENIEIKIEENIEIEIEENIEIEKEENITLKENENDVYLAYNYKTMEIIGVVKLKSVKNEHEALDLVRKGEMVSISTNDIEARRFIMKLIQDEMNEK